MKLIIFFGLLALFFQAHAHANAHANAHDLAHAHDLALADLADADPADADPAMTDEAARGKKKGHKDKEPKIKLKKLPHCSLECVTNAMAKAGCGATDYACGCLNYSGLKKKATACVLKKCGIHTARRKVLPAVKALCDNQALIDKKLEEEYMRTKSMSELQMMAEATPMPKADGDGK